MMSQFTGIYNIICVLFFCVFLGCQNISNNNQISTLDSLSFLINQDPENISYLQNRSDIYYENHNFNLAQHDINKAYELFKNDVNILLKRGKIHYSLNQTRISKESWERCLKI